MKNAKQIVSATLAFILLVSIVLGAVYVYTWYSKEYNVTDSDLSSTSEILGDGIVNHNSTVKASVLNSRMSSVSGNVTVNIVWANESFVTTIWPEEHITLGSGVAWDMTDQTWKPTQTGSYMVEVVFEEET